MEVSLVNGKDKYAAGLRAVEEARRICEARGRESDGSRRSLRAAWRLWREAVDALDAIFEAQRHA